MAPNKGNSRRDLSLGGSQRGKAALGGTFLLFILVLYFSTSSLSDEVAETSEMAGNEPAAQAATSAMKDAGLLERRRRGFPRAAAAILARLLPPAHAARFHFELMDLAEFGSLLVNGTPPIRLPRAEWDVFSVHARAGQVRVRGTTAVAMAAGAYYYIKHALGGRVTWGSNRSGLSLAFAGVQGEEQLSRLYRDLYVPPTPSNVPFRYAWNTCTHSYSAAWWSSARWRAELDWMALHGINMPLAHGGQEYVWMRVFTYRLTAMAALEKAAVQVGKRRGDRFKALEYRNTLGAGQVLRALQDWFTGPAFLTWHRMGNIQQHGGPLMLRHMIRQSAVQRRVLRQARALGMVPVLACFAGHVPGLVREIMPKAQLHVRQGAGWLGFRGTETAILRLQPDSVAYQVIGQAFMTEQQALYGDYGDYEYEYTSADPYATPLELAALETSLTDEALLAASTEPGAIRRDGTIPIADHYYNCDTFNEIDPDAAREDALRVYLRHSSAAVVATIRAVDPAGVWVMQGWLFYFSRHFWSPERTKAYLDGAPNSAMLILDLFSESMLLSPHYNNYHGKPWIWNMLLSFGGTPGLYGSRDGIAIGAHHAAMRYGWPMAGPVSGATANMVGIGFTSEAVEHNPMLFELLTDVAGFGLGPPPGTALPPLPTVKNTERFASLLQRHRVLHRDPYQINTLNDWQKQWAFTRYGLAGQGEESDAMLEAKRATAVRLWSLMSETFYRRSRAPSPLFEVLPFIRPTEAVAKAEDVAIVLDTVKALRLALALSLGERRDDAQPHTPLDADIVELCYALASNYFTIALHSLVQVLRSVVRADGNDKGGGRARVYSFPRPEAGRALLEALHNVVIPALLDVFTALDTVLASSPNHLLGRWVAEAVQNARQRPGKPTAVGPLPLPRSEDLFSSLGSKPNRLAAAMAPDAEYYHYLHNALVLVTTWHRSPGAALDGYSRRGWAGLVGGYFRGRWACVLRGILQQMRYIIDKNWSPPDNTRAYPYPPPLPPDQYNSILKEIKLFSTAWQQQRVRAIVGHEALLCGTSPVGFLSPEIRRRFAWRPSIRPAGVNSYNDSGSDAFYAARAFVIADEFLPIRVQVLAEVDPQGHRHPTSNNVKVLYKAPWHMQVEPSTIPAANGVNTGPQSATHLLARSLLSRMAPGLKHNDIKDGDGPLVVPVSIGKGGFRLEGACEETHEGHAPLSILLLPTLLSSRPPDDPEDALSLIYRLHGTYRRGLSVAAAVALSLCRHLWTPRYCVGATGDGAFLLLAFFPAHLTADYNTTSRSDPVHFIADRLGLGKPGELSFLRESRQEGCKRLHGALSAGLDRALYNAPGASGKVSVMLA